MYENPRIPTLARRVGVSALLGLVIAGIGSLLEAIIDHHSAFSSESLDDIVVGVLVALIIFAYEQRRYRSMLDKVRVIAAMNHHVRNALQAISYAPYADQEKQIRMIRDSVARIQWALREILPGEVEAPENSFTASTKEH
jgi:hypothetical protein